MMETVNTLHGSFVVSEDRGACMSERMLSGILRRQRKEITVLSLCCILLRSPRKMV